jgi:hypothetical protein
LLAPMVVTEVSELHDARKVDTTRRKKDFVFMGFGFCLTLKTPACINGLSRIVTNSHGR